MIESSGSSCPRNRSVSGLRKGRSVSGSLMRRATTETCAVVNEIIAPKA